MDGLGRRYAHAPAILLALAATLAAALLLQCVHASVWDPHPFPSSPPFFEGWYMRATLQDSNDTLAVLFASSLLPPDAGEAPLPAVYIGILHGDSEAGRTFVYEATPPLRSVQITTRGHNVTTAPDWRTPPAFAWSAEGGGGALSMVMEGARFFMRGEAKAPGGGRVARVWAELEVEPWAYDGGVARPHSWTDVSERARLHWYIHSLASRLTYLRLELDSDNAADAAAATSAAPPRVLTAMQGLVHLEKNWGSRFPHAWLWAQGSSPLSTTTTGKPAPVSFVISYGAVSPDPEGPFTHFGHFRDEDKALAWDFKPDDSFVSRTEVDSCGGMARIVLHGFDAPITLDDGSMHRPRRRLALDFHRPAGTAACLLGPTGRGLERLCEETFQATARLTATLDGRLVREAMFERVALELGAGLLCNGTCSGGSGTGPGPGVLAAWRVAQ